MAIAFLLQIDGILLLASDFWPMVGLVTLVVAWRIGVIVDAFRTARRAGTTALKRYQRWYIYAVLAVLFVGNQVVVDMDRPLPAFSIPSSSMSPALRVGDRIIASTRWFKSHEPARGDLAVHASVGDPGVMYIKRIVGLPGDRVQYKAGRLYINGAPVERTALAPDEVVALSYVGDRSPQFYWEQLPGGPRYVIGEMGDDTSLDNTEEVTVPPGNVFLLGDNRDNAKDSRTDGYLPLKLLYARPLYIFWSRDWNRIGESLQP